MNVAIIPARGGSKGIVRKNIIPLCGKPLIAWTISQARGSRLVDAVFVSTDDEEIADVSRRYGAEVVDRPSELASDTSSSEDVLVHAIADIENSGQIAIERVVFLQATSPVRENDDIDNALRKYTDERADSLFSCTAVQDHFLWARRDGILCSVNYDFRNRKRKQELATTYIENGSIYIFTPQLIRRENNRLGGKVSIYEMPFWKSFQIDQMDHLEVCEYYIKTKLMTGVEPDAG